MTRPSPNAVWRQVGLGEVRLSVRRATVGLLVLGLGWAGSAGAVSAQTPGTRTVVLHAGRSQELRINFDYSVENTLPPFENEPALNGKMTARGLIPTVPPTPLLRNITDNELYLKIDHNRNFSQGERITYKSRYVSHHVLFENLRVATQRGSLTIPYLVNLYTYERGCSGWLMVESSWKGQLDLDGRKWTLGIVDNLDGQIDSGDLLYLTEEAQTDPTTQAPMCPVPQTLFLAGRTFRLDFAFKSADKEVVLEATLTELHPTLGQLNVTADSCVHLRLEDDGQTVLLNRPAGVLSLPIGNYRVADCILYDQQKQRRGPPFVRYSQTVSITTGQIASLRLGAPLNNTVEVSRHGNLLSLKHQLVGAGGEQYNDYHPRIGPSFAVYKGPLKIGAGDFPFG
jgi:hypothetical protein